MTGGNFWRHEWQRRRRQLLSAGKAQWQSWQNRALAYLQQHPRTVVAGAWVALLMLAVLLIPGILVRHSDQPNGIVTGGRDWNRPDSGAAGADGGPTAPEAAERPISFPIYLTKEKRIEKVTLEQYVRGVVAAEMPIVFEPEALKAQAIAARTYIVKRFADKDVSNVPVKGAWVTDSVQHQAYLTDKAILQKWDKSVRSANLQKLNKAVEETRGQIITYGGKPILAAFFSTSNGYTENSEEYWPAKLPYLRSVSSPWEAAISPKYKSTVTMTVRDFSRKLGLRGGAAAVSAAPAGSGKNSSVSIKLLETTEGNRIKKIAVNGKEFTGREVREKLGLVSTQFTWQAKGDKLQLTVYGNGHGVGMSQWGAQGMALQGYKAHDIISYYYSGVSIDKFRGPDSTL